MDPRHEEVKRAAAEHLARQVALFETWQKHNPKLHGAAIAWAVDKEIEPDNGTMSDLVAAYSEGYMDGLVDE